MKFDYSTMSKVGFSRLAVNVYAHLDEFGPAKMSTLCTKLNKSAPSLHYAAKQLTDKGFVEVVKMRGWPRYYYPIPIDRALDNFRQYLVSELQGLIDKQKSA